MEAGQGPPGQCENRVPFRMRSWMLMVAIGSGAVGHQDSPTRGKEHMARGTGCASGGADIAKLVLFRSERH